MLNNYPQTIVAAFHNIGSSGKFSNYQGDSVVRYFPNVEFSTFPDGLGHAVHILELEDTIIKRYIEAPETPVVIEVDSKTWDQVNRMVNLTLTFNNDGYSSDLQGAYWYNVIVTENNIIEPHNTWPHCSTPNTHNGQDRDTLYVNDWVTRKLIYWSQGRYLAGPIWQYQQEITNSDTFSIDPAWIPENCNIVVNVYKKADSLFKSPVMQAISVPVIGWSDIPEDKLPEKGSIEIYPNPAVDYTNVHISIPEKGNCSLYLIDLNGKIVKRILHGNRNPGFYNIELKTSEIPKGNYLMVMETKIGRTTEKLIVY